MSIRTTVTLDDDVVVRLKEECKLRAVPFRTLLNEAVRSGLLSMKTKPSSVHYKVEPVDLGTYPDVNYDNVGALLDIAEGDAWR